VQRLDSTAVECSRAPLPRGPPRSRSTSSPSPFEAGRPRTRSRSAATAADWRQQADGPHLTATIEGSCPQLSGAGPRRRGRRLPRHGVATGPRRSVAEALTADGLRGDAVARLGATGALDPHLAIYNALVRYAAGATALPVRRSATRAWGDGSVRPADHRRLSIANASFDDILVEARRLTRGGGFFFSPRPFPGRTASVVRVPGPADNVHPFPGPVRRSVAAGTGVPSGAPQRIAGELHDAAGSPRRFDALAGSSTSCSIGLRGDGHLRSVFPGSAAFDSDTQWALADPRADPHRAHVAAVVTSPSRDRPRRAAGAGRRAADEPMAVIVGRDLFRDTADPPRSLPAQTRRSANAVRTRITRRGRPPRGLPR
jgi:hypothetical protein